ncbi:amidase signature domain-containing protein [Xylaria intraflava]|nr:amidase signature domain-containing protein [Xylaria intraflava]
MALVTMESGSLTVTGDDLKPVLEKTGITLTEPLLNDYSTLLTVFENAIDSLPDDRPVQPIPDLAKYPRKDIHIPEDTDMGGWATKNDLLKGRTVALKDNIALAGVRCTYGTSMVDWTPEIDATVATRVMDAGAIITGKAACENACMDGISCTSCTGPVHNPYGEGYSAGGSSSGCARLVATGSVDLALGGDQGGSIRLPAASCGIVGLKPTWGLVPYTGILSMDPTIDHTGPMTKTVRDCALLLDVIAGPDGWDDRQAPPELAGPPLDSVRDVDAVTQLPKNAMLAGVKIGILAEGFQVTGQDSEHAECVRAAIMKFTELGATVTTVSVPKHTEAATAWLCLVPGSCSRGALLGDAGGRKQLYLPDRSGLLGAKLTQAQFDALGPAGGYMYLAYNWAQERHGPKLHGRCMNLLKAASDAYDSALKEVDVLVTPTLPRPPIRFPGAGYGEGPLKWMASSVGLLANTCTFNATGHPALSLPVGFTPALEDPTIKLPAGMQIIGRKYRDADCLKVAAAWEKAFDWKTQ